MKHPTPVHQAPDMPVEVEADTEVTRKKIADRDWLDSDGKPVGGDSGKTEEDAVAARYTTLLGSGGSHTFTPKTDDASTRMLAIFGALTLMGNLANTWKTEKGEKPDSPIEIIGERFALLEDGKWIDRSAGAVGTRIDKDVLAEAIVLVTEEAGKVPTKFADVGEFKAAVRQRLEDDAPYVRSVRQVAPINAKYAELVGRTTKSVDDVLDF